MYLCCRRFLNSSPRTAPQVFKPQAAPAALITDVRTKPLGAVEEDGEEEEEDIAVSLSSGALSPAGGNWPMADTPLSGLGAGSERPSSGWNTFPINTTVGNTDVSGAAVGGEEQARPEGLSRQLSSACTCYVRVCETAS